VQFSDNAKGQKFDAGSYQKLSPVQVGTAKDADVIVLLENL
jgi:hypothetical protein